jgi:hypothetical protein
MNSNLQEIKIKPNFFTKENLRLVALILLTIIPILIITLAIKDVTAYYNTTFIYISIILICICSVFAYIINGFDNTSKGFIYMFSIIVFASIIIIFISFKVGLVDLLTNNYFSNFLLIIIALIGLAIFYYMFLEKIINRPGWPSFIIKFIFYIPCLFTDGIKYFIQDFQSTPKRILYLLFIEFILILIYFYFYPRLERSIYNNGLVLLKDPVSLNLEQRIDSEFYNTLIFKNPGPNTSIPTINSPIRHTFSLSLWVYLNTQPTSQLSYTKESTLFGYVSRNNEGHPKITYKNDEKGNDTYILYLSPTTKYEMSLPYQKWNNIIFNYRNLYVDLFINGNLEKSISLNEMPSFSNNDMILVGETGINDRTGLYGSICNIVYYKNILTKGEIVEKYNLLNIRNPPIF